MTDKTFSPEQQEFLRSEIQAQSNGTFTPERQEYLRTGINQQMVTPYVPTAFRVDYSAAFKNKRNLVADANMSIPLLDDNASDAEIQSHDELVRRKNNAIETLDIVRYNRENNQSKLEDINEFAKRYHELNPSLTKEQIEIMYSEKMTDEWQTVLNNNGVLLPELYGNRQFALSVNPKTYAKLANAYNIQNNTWSISNGWKAGAELHDLNQKLIDGKIDFETYQRESNFVNSTYSKEDESQTWKSIGQILNGMWKPIEDHPVYTASMALLALPTRGATLRYGMPALYAYDTYQQQQAESLSQAWEENPQLEREKVLHDSRIYNLIGAGLEVAADMLTFGIASRAIRPLTQAVRRAMGKGAVQETLSHNAIETLTKADNKEVAEQIGQSLKQSLRKNAAIIAGEGALNVVVQTGTEMAQDALATHGASVALGITDEEEIWRRDVQAATQAGKESVAPIAILSALGISTRLIGSTYQIQKHNNEVENLINKAFALDVVDDAIQEQGIATQDVILDSVLSSKIYVDKEQMLKDLEDAGIDVQHLDPSIQKKLNDTKQGEATAFTASEFKKIPSELRDKIKAYATDEQGELYPHQLQKILADEKAEQLRTQIQEDIAQRTVLRARTADIQQNIYKQLSKIDGTDKKKNDRLASLYGAFFESLSQATGLDVDALYQQYIPSLKKYAVDNYTSEQNGIDNRNTTGTYDSDTRTITVKRGEDFASLLHESAHFFLDTLLKVAKTNEQVRANLMPLAQWANIKKDITKLNDKEISQLQEQFVSALFVHLLGGKTSEKLKGFTKRFKQFISSLKNTAIWQNKANDSLSNSDFLKQNFKATYGYDMPDIDSNFSNFVDTLFASEVQDSISASEYDPLGLLDAIDSSSLNDEVKANLKQSIAEQLEGMKADREQVITEYNFSYLLTQFGNSKDTIELVKQYIEKLPKEVTEQRGFKTKVNRIFKLADKFNKARDEAQKEYEQNKPVAYRIFDDLHDAGFTFDLSDISPKERERLEKRGFKHSVEGLSLEDVLDVLTDEQKSFLGTEHPAEKLKNLLLNLPSKAEYLNSVARDRIRDQLTEHHTTSLQELNRELAKIYEKKARAFLRALAKAQRAGATEEELSLMVERIGGVALADTMDSTYRDANVEQAIGNARNQQLKTQDKLLSNDIEGAVRNTRNELYLNTKAQLIAEYKGKIQKVLRHFKHDVFKRGWQNDKNFARTYDLEVMKLAYIALKQVGVVENNLFDMSNVDVDAIKQSNPQAIPEIEEIVKMLNEGEIANNYYQSQRIGDLLKLCEKLVQIKQLAKNARSIYTENQILSQQQIEKEIIAKLSSLPNKRGGFSANDSGGVGLNRTQRIRDIFLHPIREYFHYVTLVEQRFMSLDGDRNTLGVFHTLYQMVRDGVTNYSLSYADVINRQIEALNKVKVKKGTIDCPDFVFNEAVQKATGGTHLVLGTGRYKNRATHELLGILLHLGTNRTKFINGYIKGETFEEREQTLIKWFRRMCNEGYITREMMDFCQTIWNINKELETPLNRAAKAIKGFGFRPLDHRKIRVEFADGTIKNYEAGYVPAMLNTEINEPMYDPTKGLFENLSMTEQRLALNNPGFLEERTAVQKALCCDPLRLIAQTSDVLRYSHIIPAVVQVQRVLNSKNIKSLLEDKEPRLYEDVIEPWLLTSATMKTSSPNSGKWGWLGNFVLGFTRTCSKLLMIYNVNNTIQQISNIPAVVSMGISPASLTKNLGKMICNYGRYDSKKDVFSEGMRKDIAEKSKFMRLRYKEVNNSQETIWKEVLADPGVFDSTIEKAKASYRQLQQWQDRHAFILQKKAQDMIDTMVWQSAYEKALREKKTEQQAVEWADMVVRTTLGSFDVPDIAKASKSNPYFKALAMFGNYFYSMWNLLEMQLKLVSKQYDISDPRRYFHYVYQTTLTLMLPALIAEFVNQAVGTGDLWNYGDDEETDEQVRSALFWSAPRMMLGSMPILGKLGQGTIDYIEGKQYYSSALLSSPILTTINSGYHATVNLINPDKELKGREVAAIVKMVGLISGHPLLGFTSRPVSYFYDVENSSLNYDNYSNDFFVFLEQLRGGVTGHASDETKP